MIACLFRFPFRNTAPIDRYVGIAVASNMKSLFWQIDIHGDPFGCELSILTNSIHSASICTRQVIFPEDDDKDTEHSDVELHTYDYDREWITPNWGEVKL